MGRYDHLLHPAKKLIPLNEITRQGAAKYGKYPAMRRWKDDQYEVWTYNELHQKVESISRWLISKDIAIDEHVAIIGDNSPEWEASYLGIQGAGAVCIPIDRMLPASGIRHVLADSGAKMLFAESSYLESLREVEDIETLGVCISTDDISIDNSLLFSDVLAEGEKLEMELPKRSLEDLAAILYTSGTTGHSKGVMLSHHNIIFDAAAAGQLYPIGPEDTWLSILPVHHSFEATAGFIYPLFSGSNITFARSLKSTDIVAGIKETNVTFMNGVPLLFEKMQQGIIRNVNKKGKVAKTLFNTIMGIVKFGEIFGLNLGVPLFRSIRKKAGMDSIKHFLSAGGPLDPEISKFFNRLGFHLFQGYGLTETAPCTHLTPPWKTKHECVGIPLDGVEVKILDPDKEGVGEVCAKGPNVFLGYYKNPEATRETFTEDGWFKTGDLGFIHDDDYLQITGRKKAMLVTAGGKNVYPEEIEFYLNRSAFIAESVVLGINRLKGLGEEVAALIHPDYEQIDLYFEKIGIKGTPEKVFDLIRGEIQKAQDQIADYKRIKLFRVFEEEFQKTTKRTIKRFLYHADMLKMESQKV